MPVSRPVSDHFDGEHFFNPGATQARGFGAVLRWQMKRQKARWPARLSNPAFPPPGATVAPGDLIVGDLDGVLVVPAAHVADVVHRALAKAEGEDRVRAMIGRGMSTADIFDQTGIM